MVSFNFSNAVVCLNRDFFDFDVEGLCELSEFSRSKVRTGVMDDKVWWALVDVDSAFAD